MAPKVLSSSLPLLGPGIVFATHIIRLGVRGPPQTIVKGREGATTASEIPMQQQRLSMNEDPKGGGQQNSKSVKDYKY